MKAKDVAQGIKDGTIDPEAAICIEIPGGGYPVMAEAEPRKGYRGDETEYETQKDGKPTVAKGPVLFFTVHH